MKVELVTVREGKSNSVMYEYLPREEGEKPMALDVLLQAQATKIPDLSFRYGCRNRTCGICTVDINGKPRIACRARVRDGDQVSAVSTLPVVRDMVAKRDGVARQLRGKLPTSLRGNDLNVEAPEDYHALTACIECYACLDHCPMHERNLTADGDERDENGSYRWGSPFSFLKMQRIRLDPVASEADKEEALSAAQYLGLEICRDCPGCKCGVGIDLKRKVVKPLLEAIPDSVSGD
ncbi:uncharacterized protein METZ01_LOCUS298050 [marine metagenome]|uniref:2Fe-2S ferredoxin-type domain-containing protein n=1 Tax=marine metagenome TaxID=408172 RepID=A0A382M8M5_9ZZZZ